MFKDYNYHTHTLEKNAYISLTLEEIKKYSIQELQIENSKIFLSLHPWYLPTTKKELPAEFIEMAKSDLIYGIGEIGADKNSKVPYDVQLYYLEELLKLAVKIDKVIQLHIVKSWNEVKPLLDKYPIKKIYFHGFLGKIEYLKSLLDYGLFVSLNPKMLSRPELNEFLNNNPQYLENLGLETD